MYGRVILDGDGMGRKVQLRRETLCGLPVLTAAVPAPRELSEKRLERRVCRAALRLWESGVSRVLTPPHFPWWPTLERAGLAEVETAELCRSVAAPLALTVLTLRGWEPGRAVVALSGKRVSVPMLRAAETLALRVCRLVVDVPVGGEELAAYLHEEYGLPVLPPGVVRPALTLAFDESGQGRGAVLKLWGTPQLLGARLWAPGLELPPDCDPLPLLAALRESGLLPPGGALARPVGNAP